MALEKVSFGNCIIFALALAEVTSWTLDLPEARKFFFEKNEMEKKYDKHIEDYKYRNGEERDGPVFYSNIEGNSKHNSEHYDDYENTAYAKEYGYQSYMEKKVHSIVYNGSIYLEGLRRALENYTQFLENCNRMGSRNGSTFASNSSTMDNSTSFDNSTSIDNSTNSRAARCREATKESEHVRRLSQLATWATRELQDIAYARKYKKGDYDEMSKEENELILKLAWFLDRLAYFTGYDPKPRDFLEDDKPFSTTTAPPPSPFTLVSPSEEVKRAMMECLKLNSSLPADERCRYPEPLPPNMQTLIEMNNMTGMAPVPSPSSSNQDEQVVLPLASESRANPVSEQSMELLIASDNYVPISNFPPHSNLMSILTEARHLQKRSILSMPETEVPSTPTKRSNEDDPAINFLKYYAKHKVWEGSNLKKYDPKSHFEEYEVKNDIVSHKIQKREVEFKKMKHLRFPENPFQDLSKYVQHKPGTNYVRDKNQAEKIKADIEKMRNSKPLSSKMLLRKYNKMFRRKRSIKFEHDVDLPRKSEDPQGDLSYYIKNKPGTNYDNNLIQALRVRNGLQQIFANPNIEVVRRYGANYNPLIPDALMAGVLKSMVDF